MICGNIINELGGTKEMIDGAVVVASNVGCSILASIIYDIGKICLGKFYLKKDKYSKEEIEELIQKQMGDKYEVLYMSGEFNFFLETPFFKDIIENYIIYKITGNCEGDIRKVKKNSNLITEKEIIDYLLNYLFQEYFCEVILKPSEKLVGQFFEDFFKLSMNYIVSLMKSERKVDVFLVNNRIDFAQENILLRLNETVETIKRTMNCEIIPVKDIYKDHIKEYHKILKTNHSRAHVYLLDTFDFAKFYVPPFLKVISLEQNIGDDILWTKQDYFRYAQNKLRIEGVEYFDDWKYIFENSGIVYVTGGAGYGKSLFLKKLINDFEEMNILNSPEYLVIYGDLKSFYAEGEQPISVERFLQCSMVKETLMDEKYFPIEMIEYYIKMGRCLILFDALDEVEKQKREELHKRIIAYFKNQNPNNKICITSRNRGFIPEKDVEVYDILPLDRIQIESYVDNIIKLGRFDAKDKNTFLEQSSVLVEKGFLSSFLVLSLLINIYKAERELPENKMELYQKCFDYIAYRREKEKTKAKFDWDLISCMMKDNTFMELARMCFPNNSDIGKDEIVDMLCNTYRGKYRSEAETERAAENFLAFCSDRTELFVPAAGEDRFKFFHRSFFEYFYAQYIFLRIRDVEKVYGCLEKFDVDSEVFELTLAMMKQKDEFRYQELMNYIFKKAEEEVNKKNTKLCVFNILTLGMQVVDDNVYMLQYVKYLVEHSGKIVKNIDSIPNQGIIYAMISGNDCYIKQINAVYGFIAKLSIIEALLDNFLKLEKIMSQEDFLEICGKGHEAYVRRRFYVGYENTFYVRVYVENTDLSNILCELSAEELDDLLLKNRESKRTKEKYIKAYKRFIKLDKKKQKWFTEVLLCRYERVSPR